MSLSDDEQFSMAEKAWKPTAKKSTQSHGAEEDEDDDPEQADPVPVAPPEPPAEVVDETWEEQDDKQNAVPKATPEPTDQKYQYKEEQWKPIDPEDKKRYDREFLLGFQFISTSMNKPDGLPTISGVVLDKPRMDQYFNQMDQIIKEKKTSSRISLMLQDVLDLRKADPVPVAPPEPPAEVVDETWEEQEDKQNAVPKTTPEPTDQKYQYKEEQWKPIDPEDKKRYDREFLLGFQFISTSMNKPDGLPTISGVVLDKPRMDQYFNQMDQIIKEKKTSSRISLMLQDVLDLRKADPVPVAPPEPPAEVVDETWEEQEDKQNAVPKATPEPTDQKYQYKEEQWKPIDPEDKKRYDREFLLGFQFISARMNKPDGLPTISDVVLDKANKTPMRPPDPARMMNVGPDFTPSYLGNLGSRSVGGPRGPQGQRKEPSKIILSSMSLGDDVQLNKAEKAWKPAAKKSTRERAAEEEESDDPEQAKTQELFKRLRSILNKLTPQKFQELMRQVMDMTIDTEERLKGAVDLIFEKAISEPNFSVAYANMCRCLMGLKVLTSDKPGVFVNFRKLLLNRCQKEFEKDQDDDEIFEKKQKDMEAAKEGEERERLRVELQDSRDQARRRSLGNIKFIGELFKLKMLTEAIMHDCVVKLLKNHDEESLECLCRLFSTIGKDLDFEKAKPRMDQYFNQMDKIIKEKKTSSRIRFMLQDVLDLRKSNWVQDKGWNMGGRGFHTPGRRWTSQPQDEGWNTRFSKITKSNWLQDEGWNMGGRGFHTLGRRWTSQYQDEGWNTRLSKITKPPWPHRSHRGHRKKPRKIISPEQVKTQELFNSLHCILDKLTPQKFRELMKQVMDLTIDTEERLKGAVELIFEKAISDPNSSMVYANMCRCLMGLEVPTSDKPGVFVNFRNLLLNCCQKEFEKEQDDDVIIAKKQQEIEAAKEGEEREHLRVELQESRDQARRRSLGNIMFIGELFKLKILNEVIMYICIGELLKNHDEESLECLYMMLSTIGKDLDLEKAKPRMDQYFNQMDQIIKEKKTSSRISLMLQDVLDLRKSNWVPRKGDQGPKTIDQIQKEAEMEEHREHMSKKEGGGGGGGGDRMGGNNAVKRESAPTPPPSLPKPALSEEKLEKKSNAIIEEYLHINDLKEALQCVTELNSASLLYVFVRNGVESTLERSTVAREHMGMLLHQLVKAEVLPTEQYYKGLEETLEAAEDTAIDIPHIWLYLAELIIPMLHEGGIPMGQLFREISKPLVPLGQAGVMLVQILKLLCKEMTPKKVGAMWTEGGLNWSDFLPEDEDVNKFVTEQKVEFTTGEETESKEVDEKKVLTGEETESKEVDEKKVLTGEETESKEVDEKKVLTGEETESKEVDEKANLDEQQTASNQFVRALMTSVCQSAIIGDNSYRVDAQQISRRASLLQRYLSDEQKELQALYALQALMVHMEQPANLLRMFFDVLYDEDVIEEEAFYKWETSKDPAEQTGKGVALRSVTAFFTSLREEELVIEEEEEWSD
ncbi:eukaryotic translation initiation factor 4 gamma 1-like [Sebastes umbrosus]|uniref:eukaryotic translation initiation factor 4 gamma 1-like n=1 Tax=Sebastes umbrosus TaxID=72105 RepID=UPI0018A07CB0|nr:eukaryotic translation initiation factor 4 gamma 1-like [Sebastes umbrosus]